MFQSDDVRLEILALLDPGSLARVSNIFTVRGIIPQEITCWRRTDDVEIRVVLDSPGAGELDKIAHRIEALVCVTRVAVALACSPEVP